MEHLEIVVLSPSRETLVRYIEGAWKDFNKEELLSRRGEKEEGEWEKSIQYWFNNPMQFDIDNKAANNASIAFLLIYDGHYMLFSGDASPDQMVASGKEYLRRTGRDGESLKLDLIKLPHHGSSHNINDEFLRIFRTKRYLISTKGHERYKHPGKRALALIASILNCEETAEIYCNYNWWREKESFWWAERREGNWNQNCCVLKGRDGRLRSLSFYQLDTVPIRINNDVWLGS